MKKIFKENIINIVIIMIFIFSITAIISILENNYKKRQNYLNSDEYKTLVQTQKKCEHEFITVSSGYGKSLKVYSKCYKCGKEIRD